MSKHKFISAEAKALMAKKEAARKQRNQICLIAGIAAAVIAIAAGVWFGTAEERAAARINTDVTHTAVIEIENYGVIELALCGNAAPKTVERFVTLAEDGFYDGLTFHRIMEGYMMQGGCPEGTGRGKWEKNLLGEFAANGFENPLSHKRGAISMARANDPNSASCQFFIVHKDQPMWDGQYATFGYVTKGMDVVDAVCTTVKPIDGNGTIPAEQQPKIVSVTVEKAR